MVRGETGTSQVLMQLSSAVQLALSIMHGRSFDDDSVIRLLPRDLELQFHHDGGTRNLVFAYFDMDWLRKMTQVFCEDKRGANPEWSPSWNDVVDFFAICGSSCAIPEVPTDKKIDTTPATEDDSGIIGHVGLFKLA